MQKFKKIISILLIITIIFSAALPGQILAAETPEQPEVSQSVESPQVVDSPEEPEAPEAPQSTETQQNNDSNNTDPNISPTPTETKSEESPLSPSPSPSLEDSGSQENSTLNNPAQDQALSENQTGNIVENGNTGTSTIETNNAQVSGAVINTGNTNAVIGDANTSSTTSVTNTGNGTDSQNSGTVIEEKSSTVAQNNEAEIDNNLNLEANTGVNSASKNVGDSKITTGDANVSGSIVNAVNTNVDGVLISEVNVVDDYIGDIALNFSNPSSLDNGENLSIENTDNGSDSQNTGEINLTEDNLTSQNNNADVENEMVLIANTGENTTSNNTGGDSQITTGDANVSGNVVNFLNNNLTGEVVYTVVNIFGDLIGDIIMPDNIGAVLGLSANSIINSGNGSSSTNSGSVNQTENNQISQSNNAQIVNNIDLVSTTGNNQTSSNTDGNNSIATGDSSIEAQVVNIANNNIVGGVWWIVLVNEMGNWVGKIIGPEGSGQGNYAGSQGTEFTVEEDGTVNVVNTGNGSGSVNNADVSQINTEKIIQSNDAYVVNNIELTANTGGNAASRNTGGDSKIKTGDAKVMLSLVNFVNNNFARGKVLFTVVNVFGNWVGDIITPGGDKDKNNENPNNDEENNSNDDSSQDSKTEETNSGSSNNQGSSNSSPNNQTSSSSSNSSNSSSTDSKTSFIANDSKSSGLVSNPAVAGISIDMENPNDKSNPNKKSIQINLAWLILTIPVFLALFLLRRRLKTSENQNLN